MKVGDIVRSLHSQHLGIIGSVTRVSLDSNVVDVKFDGFTYDVAYYITNLELIKKRVPKYPKLWSK